MATTTRPESVEIPSHPVLDVDIPPLQNGDRLTRAEFERRYDAMPHLKKAELIEGIVHIPSPDSYPIHQHAAAMASPVSHRRHSNPHFRIISWLGQYSAETPGIEGGDNGSVRMDLDNMPQPDAFLIVAPEYGGQVRISDDDYIEGAPDLVVEVAASSVSYDLHAKLNVYRRNGVREYIVWRVRDRIIDWYVLREGRFDRLAPGDNGLYRSEVFPGLWLESAALLRGEMPIVLGSVRRGLEMPAHAAFVDWLKQQATGPR